MRKLWALLIDTYQESLDRKSTFLLLLLAGGLALITFSFSVEARDPAEVLEEVAEGINEFHFGSGPTRRSSTMEVDFTVDAAKSARGEADLPAEFRDGYVVRILFPRRWNLTPLIRSWWSFEEYISRGLNPDQPALDLRPVGQAEEVEFFERRFREFGYTRVLAQQRGRSQLAEDPLVYRVAVVADRPMEVHGAARLSVGFGLFEIPLRSSSPAQVVFHIQDFLANSFVGFFGMLVAISTCASFVPNLLRRGTLDLALARPVSRGQLILYKYVGAVIYVFVFAVVLFGGSALGLWFSTGVFSPVYLYGIGTMTLMFAVLFAVTVLFGVWTRSTNIASLAGLGTWALALGAGKARELWDFLFPEGSASIRQVVEVVYTVLPNTHDLTTWSRQQLAYSELSPQARERMTELFRAETDWTVAGSTTTAFAVGALFLALWSFQRKDC